MPFPLRNIIIIIIIVIIVVVIVSFRRQLLELQPGNPPFNSRISGIKTFPDPTMHLGSVCLRVGTEIRPGQLTSRHRTNRHQPLHTDWEKSQAGFEMSKPPYQMGLDWEWNPELSSWCTQVSCMCTFPPGLLCVIPSKVKDCHLYSSVRPRRESEQHFVFCANAQKTHSHFINNDSSFRLSASIPLFYTSPTGFAWRCIIIKTEVYFPNRRFP